MLQTFASPLRPNAPPPVPLGAGPARLPISGQLGALLGAVPATAPAANATAHALRATPATGAVERDELAPLARCLAHMLDEIDYGMLLVDGEGQVLYVNHVARCELGRNGALQLDGRTLVAPAPAEAATLQQALADAQRGRRRLVTLGRGERFVAVSVVPLPGADARGGATLLILGKRGVCEELSVLGYARARELTPAETRVLGLLCAGVKPTRIAAEQGVAVSTVRTQIGSIRAKTGTNSIRELVSQVAVLPPLVGALRSTAVALGAARMPLCA